MGKTQQRGEQIVDKSLTDADISFAATTALSALADTDKVIFAIGSNVYVVPVSLLRTKLAETFLSAVPDASVAYAKVANSLKSYATLSSGTNIDLSANLGGKITLAANTAFSFINYQEGKSYELIITANGFTPSWANGSKHKGVTGNETFGTTGVFKTILTCENATSGSEILRTLIMKEA